MDTFKTRCEYIPVRSATAPAERLHALLYLLHTPQGGTEVPAVVIGWVPPADGFDSAHQDALFSNIDV